MTTNFLRGWALFLPMLLATTPLWGEQGGGTATWRELAQGFEQRPLFPSKILGRPHPPDQAVLQVLRLDPRRYQVALVDVRQHGLKSATVKEMARLSGAIAVINGGFFLEDYRPLGLLISQGQVLNPLRRAEWGIFLVRYGLPDIIHTSQYRGQGGISEALQVGPRLVVEGQVTRLKRQVARRSALGIDRSGRLILLTSDSHQLYAEDLAWIMAQPEEAGGLNCWQALNLDGGPSSQLYVNYGGLQLDIAGGWPVPNGLAIFEPNSRPKLRDLTGE